jgi:hypothetical protein
LDEFSRVEITPRLVGKQTFMQLTPAKKKKADDTEEMTSESTEEAKE